MPTSMARPVGLAASAVSAMGEQLGNGQPPPMSARQTELNRRWRWYAASQYATRAYNWDGTKRVGQEVVDQIAAQGFILPDLMGQVTYDSLPARFRHPTSPYHLARSITNRFTSLLFGAGSHPQVEVEDDDATNEFVQGLISECRLWPRMARARRFGGAMGSVGVTFRFVEGKPVVQVLDPRWATPQFRDISTNELDSCEYLYPIPRTDREGRVTWWWSRRLITSMADVTYELVPCDERRPQWVERERHDHGLGFFPGVWIQNSFVEEDIDGEPDCWGIYDQLEEMDQLLSAASIGAIANCDPTVVLSTDMEVGQVKKGSKNAIRVGKGETAQYLEMTGSGSREAREEAMLHRRLALETAACVIDEQDEKDMTATATRMRYAAMHARAGEFQEQYGEDGTKPLMGKMVRAARQLGTGVVGLDGTTTRFAVSLPPVVRDGVRVERQVGNGESVKLTWPSFTRPTPEEAGLAATATSTALQSGVIDRSTAVTYVAPFFGGGDPTEIQARADSELAQRDDAQTSELLRGLAATGAGAPGQVGLGAPVQWSLEELKMGACTIDEYRQGRGAGVMPGGAGARTVAIQKPTETEQLGAAGSPGGGDSQ